MIYAYCQGVRSSRQIERRCVTDVAFRVVCAQDVPDHATIARFRAEHQDTFAALFTQVLLVAAAAGLARLGTVAVDGTKIPANASIDANRGQEWLEAQVRQILTEAQRLDAAEDIASAASSSDDGDDDGSGETVPARLRDCCLGRTPPRRYRLQPPKDLPRGHHLTPAPATDTGTRTRQPEAAPPPDEQSANLRQALRRGDQTHHLQHERDRVAQHPLP